MPTASALDLPRTPTGFQQVFHALRAHTPRRGARLPAEPRWRSDFIDRDATGARVALQEFGYTARELSTWRGRTDDTAVVGPFRLLTEEGLGRLTEVCEQLEGPRSARASSPRAGCAAPICCPLSSTT
ncbi:hypothetical protein ACFQ2B_32415 [Streptomyces stramineus]